MRATLLQSGLTLCDTMDCSPPGSSVHGILRARILKWVAVLEPMSLESPALAGRFFTTRTTWEIVVKIGTVFFSKLQLKPSDCPEMLLVTPSVDHESLLIWNNCNNNLDSHQQMLKLLSENLVRKRMFG